ncbi:MAG: Hint domain-containing homing endonuclease [Cetobacterium sp.]
MENEIDILESINNLKLESVNNLKLESEDNLLESDIKIERTLNLVDDSGINAFDKADDVIDETSNISKKILRKKESKNKSKKVIKETKVNKHEAHENEDDNQLDEEFSEIVLKPKKPRLVSHYDVDISEIPSYINSMVKFMGLHPEFFKTNVSKKMIYLHDNQIYNVFEAPVYFKDTIHSTKGYITTEYDKNESKYKMIISIKTTLTKSVIDVCYPKRIETYMVKQAKHGDHVELSYNKILNDIIIKHCYYSQPVKQWEEDVEILKKEFFLPSKSGLLSIMNNKINNEKIGSITNSWNNLILYGPYGSGKCLAPDTPVLMFDGTIKNVQDITLDDVLMGDDSTPRNVLELSSGESDMYEVTYLHSRYIGKMVNSYGSSRDMMASPLKYDTYTVNENHILSMYYNGDLAVLHSENKKCYRTKYFCTETFKLLERDFYYDYEDDDASSEDYSPDKISRYDAYKKAMSFMHSRSYIVNIPIKTYMQLTSDVKCNLKGYTTLVEFEQRSMQKIENFIKNIPIADHIPHECKTSSRTQRSRILMSILDYFTYREQCSSIFEDDETTQYNLKNANTEFLDDIIYISRSLGYIAYKVAKNEVFIAVSNKHDTSIMNISKSVEEEKNINLFDIEIKPKGVGKYYGFSLDGNHKFVLGNFVVTHNSSFIYRISMILKLSILSIDLSLYLNKKKELYALLHGQEFCLPNSSDKQPAMTNVIIALEEFDNAIEHILDIENVFEYKDILKRRYLDMKNSELKEKSSAVIEKDETYVKSHVTKLKEELRITDTKKTKRDEIDDDYESFMQKAMLEDGIDLKSNQVFDKARLNILERREHDNEMHAINAELNNIIRSMDEDNKSNILRLNDLLELFSPAIPVKGRIIIGTTNHLEKMKSRIPALFRAGRMTNVEFSYLDWESLNQLTKYYFDKEMSLDPFEINIPTSEIVELAIRHVVAQNHINVFEADLYEICKRDLQSS